MELKVFDVEHGACALLRCDDGAQVMIDCGHNASTGWTPARHLRGQGTTHLKMLAITNYDEDHASGLPELRQDVTVGWLWRNLNVTPSTLRTLKTADGMGRGIDELVRMATEYSQVDGPRRPVFPGVHYEAFTLPYPEFDDENNLSMVVHLKVAGHSFLFPGDLEVKGWESLLARDAGLRAVVADTAVLIASHHGRESGFYPELFTRFRRSPYWVVVSDKGFMYDTQNTVSAYGLHARGGAFRGENRKVLTTRCDGSIRFWFSDGRWGAD